MSSTRTVQVDVDKSALLRELRFAFTRPSQVLAELMQNSRRAGATCVRIGITETDGQVVVEDDGCGIADFDKLLTLARSGWDEQIMADERPYGLGWFSCLYAAKEITIESAGWRLHASSDDLLAMKPLLLETCCPTEGTRLVLSGITTDGLVHALGNYAEGFPIPVYCNDEPLARPNALDSGRAFVETEFGHIWLSDGTNTAADFYLQGLPISVDTLAFGTNRNVVHLNSRKYAARLPDRANLLDSDNGAIAAALQEAIRELKVARLEQYKAALRAEVFVAKYYDDACALRCLSIFNDMDVLPPVLAAVTEYPRLPRWDDDHIAEIVDRTIYRADIESGRVKVAVEPDAEDMLTLTYLWAIRQPYLERSLDNAHWLYAHLQTLAPKITINSPAKMPRYDGHWSYNVDVVACDSFTLDGVFGAVTIKAESLYAPLARSDTDYRSTIIYPRGASHSVVNQLSDFRTEDEHDDVAESQEYEEFARYVTAHIVKDTTRVVKGMVSNLSAYAAKGLFVVSASGKRVHVGDLEAILTEVAGVDAARLIRSVRRHVAKAHK